VIEFFMGRIMEMSRGRANPEKVRVILGERLKG
jgi:Asp-tRNA(Asn)/Glu-tRNA(Gln) amidotransferase B subunit